ncbi:poly-gamma-glutamate biosynthesis protein PgsC/CapC [Qipengyuania aquimaris]|uniref:poly-gamma-glutamate biosynthesis protein PgsC/CapC n=1 Tax=Qipengyuania aquimaris TaxID=255984 RepID=UPI001FD1E255|nr:poly-gamma-glutamate biosynthesis protein PgsC/CapC [Qipengyuania aquimaris]UOR16561.1 poly-gamma-glutamate biosynthesis protein PgsC/CapC [Qipengyuania aquimaris]
MTIPIFPEGGLASSVITTVWVGVFVVCFFNLRFGWVLSGLVVPGYLVPLVILKPLAAGVIILEAVITYLIVYAFSEKLGRGRWHSVFGRDRFVALVIASIAVRLTMDGWLLPLLADWLGDRVGQFDWRNNLQSLGLVIVSLLANQFWKPGLVRGLFAALVTTGIAYVIVRFGLMEFTNFRISGISYLYEGLASSILASPKAYIILTITAMLASRMNLKYGWDFSGVLIPALIALQWYQPSKILTSFIEAGVIYAVASLVLRTPIFANTTIEGARKILLFFNIAFVYKLLLGYAVVAFSIDIKMTDLFGFGYLLSTLIAIKAHDKNIFPRLLRSTLQVSLVGAALGNIAGFALSAAVPGVARGFSELTSPTAERRGRYAALALAAATGDAHLRDIRGTGAELAAGDAAELGRLIALVEANAGSPFLRETYEAAGWNMRALSDDRLLIQRADGFGRDALVFYSMAENDISVIVPDPAAAPGLAMAALELREQQDARWVVIGSPLGPTGRAERSLVSAFANASSTRPVVLIAGEDDDGPGQLTLAGRAAAALDLIALRTALPGIEVDFGAPPARYAELVASDAVTLALRPEGVNALLASEQPQIGAPAACTVETVTAEEDILLVELAYLRFEVFEPLLAALDRGERPDLAIANADLLDFKLERCAMDDTPAWKLAAADGSSGTFFIAEDAGNDFVLQANAGQSTTVALGRTLLARSGAAALLVAPDVGSTSDSQRSSFGVATEALLRASDSEAGSRLAQLREARGKDALMPDGASLVIAPDVFSGDGSSAEPFVALARAAGLTPAVSDRSRRLSAFEAGRNRSLRVLDLVEGGRYAIFWTPNPSVEAVR